MIKFALAGNPNSGKTTLFNSLTGSTAHVGNWPGVTVDKKEGVYKKCAEPISIVDLPGIYSLSPYTPEEVISRNYILDEKPDCVINVVDATNLERNLYLTTQLLEIDVPVVIALNMIDVVKKNGNKLDDRLLEEKIGVPVVPISALKESGLTTLMEKGYATSKRTRKGRTVLAGGALEPLIEGCKKELEKQKIDNALFHAVKLAETDELEVKMHPEASAIIEGFKRSYKDDTFGDDFEALIADSRYRYISGNFSSAVTKGKIGAAKMSRSDKIDKVLTHKIWGIPIFLVILFLVFHLTFSEDLLYLGAAGVFDSPVVAYTDESLTTEIGEEDFEEGAVYFDADGNEVEAVFYAGEFVELAPVPYAYDENGEKITAFYDESGAELTVLTDEEGELLDLYDATGKKYEQFYNADGYKVTLVVDEEGAFEDVEFESEIDAFCSEINVHTFFGDEDTVYSPGIVLFNTLDTFTGLLSACASQALSSSPEWVSGIIVDGVLAGLFSVLSFLPQILLLFLFFSILEDSGYMARVAFILDRIFRRFGLSGRAFMPMIMGFGCSIPAMINTRTLADQNERTATIRVIPFFSCSAKLPILTAIAGGIVTQFGVGNADLITYSMYLLGIVTAIVSVLLMRSTTMRGEVPPFIMELPAYHVPQFKNLMLHLWDKTKHFVKKAFTIILASTIVIWFISHFSWNWQYLPDEQMNESILAGLGGFLQPLFTPLGFGSQLPAFGWVFVVAAITGLIAKENVIATFGTLAACISAGFAASDALKGVDSVVTMISATGMAVPALISFIAFNMTTIPCFAAVATAKAELPNKKSFKWTLLFWVATSYIVGTMIYLIGSWWWTSFIFAGLLAVVVFLIVLYNKGKIKLPRFAKKK